MLETENVSVFYGSHRALEGASITVDQNEIVVMLGSNDVQAPQFKYLIVFCLPIFFSAVVFGTSKDNVSASTGHVGCDSHSAHAACLCDYCCFPLVLFCIEHLVFYAPLAQ